MRRFRNQGRINGVTSRGNILALLEILSLKDNSGFISTRVDKRRSAIDQTAASRIDFRLPSLSYAPTIRIPFESVTEFFSKHFVIDAFDDASNFITTLILGSRRRRRRRKSTCSASMGGSAVPSLAGKTNLRTNVSIDPCW